MPTDEDKRDAYLTLEAEINRRRREIADIQKEIDDLRTAQHLLWNA